MATNTNLGGVFTTDTDGNITSNVFLSTENVVGLIFDTSVVGGLGAALGTNTVASRKFANGNVVELNVVKDLEEAGIDENVMQGLVKYHLDTFFALAGGTQRIFVSFMDSDTDPNFEAIEKMQLATTGILYQIGVWTAKPIATKDGEGNYVTETGSLCSKLQTVAETLGGRVGVTNYEGNAPLNILVNAPILNEAEIDLTKLPDLTIGNYSKVSVILGQPATATVHNLMYAVNHVVTTTETYAPVGNIGAVLACLAIAPANESIAHVASFNLATVMQKAELGFGNIECDTTTAEGVVTHNGTSYKATSSFTNIQTLGYLKRNNYLHKKGFIFLTTHDGLENSIFFSSDQTLSTGDYRTIARCRVMHKSRRVVRRALLPMVNGTVEVDASTGKLSASTITNFQNVVIEALDLNMVEPGTSVPQISGRSCTIDENQDVLNTDEIKINYALIPLGVSSTINVTEGFTSQAN